MATCTTPPPITTPHIRLTTSLVHIHPRMLTTLPINVPLPIYQQTDTPSSWKLLGTYNLVNTPLPESESGTARIEDSGARIILGAFEPVDGVSPTTYDLRWEVAVLERVSDDAPSVENETDHFLQWEALEEARNRERERRWEMEEAARERERERLAHLPPTPPPQDKTMTSSVSSVPTEYLQDIVSAPVTIPAKKELPASPATPTAGSYADISISMSESQYSTFSGKESEEESDGGDSDRWSVLSDGPVDRQWTVVFEEKEEVV